VWRRKWLAAVGRRAGVDSLPYAAESAALGGNLLRQKKWNDAEYVLRAALAVATEKAPGSWMTFNITSMLGGAMLGQERYGEAEPLLLKGHDGLKNLGDKVPPQVKASGKEAAERLVKLYETVGKKDEAAKWK